MTSLRAAEEVQEVYHQGMTQMNLAILYQDQGQFERAYETYQKTFGLEKRAKQPLLSCKLHHNWVLLHLQMGRFPKAEELCYELLQMSIRFRYREQQAAALNFLAMLAGQKGHLELQGTYLNQALSLLGPDRYPQIYFETLLGRGYLHWQLKKFTPAELDAEGALNLAERLSNHFMRATAFLLLGKVLRDRPKPDFEEATRCLNQAHQWIWKHQIRQSLWEVEYERGLLAEKKGERLRARNYFLSAKNALETLLQEVPEHIRQGYLRDRKLEQIMGALESVEKEV